MTQHKVAAYGILAAIAIAILTSVFTASLPYELTNSLYELGGLGFFGFGIWASVLLLKD